MARSRPAGILGWAAASLGALLGGMPAGCAGRISGNEGDAARPAAEAAPAGVGSPSSRCAFVVGTFNVRLDTASDGENAWPRREALVQQVLSGGEIWGLQEALPGQVRAIAAGLPGMEMLARSRDADPARDEACPILWNRALWSLDPQEHGTFWLSEEPGTPGSRSWDSSLPRICTYARLVPADGAPHGRGPVYVFNVHLDHRGAQSRARSAELVAQRIACRARPDPVIVLGDFNAGPDSVPLRTLLAAGSPRGSGCGQDASLRDAWRLANPDAAERGTYTGWADATEGPRIDFILVSPSLSVEDATIDARRPGGRWPSDHMPVTATLASMPPVKE